MRTRNLYFVVLLGVLGVSILVLAACGAPASPTVVPPTPATAATAPPQSTAPLAPTDTPAEPASPTAADTPSFTPTTETPTELPIPTEQVIGECRRPLGEACKLGEGIELKALGNFDPQIAVIQILANPGENAIFSVDEKKIYAVHSYVNFRILDDGGDVLSNFESNPMIITITNKDVLRDLAVSYCISQGNDPVKCQSQEDENLLGKYMELCQDPSSECAKSSELFLFDSSAADITKAWGSLPTEFVKMEPPIYQFIGTIKSLQVGDPRVGCCR